MVGAFTKNYGIMARNTINEGVGKLGEDASQERLTFLRGLQSWKRRVGLKAGKLIRL